ncbi:MULTISPECIES: flagellar protein FlaG [Thalassospira]|uniref:flagellar protein FlaG n=1 Tax=Thalassospira TaxID=168934 RepID=UPI000954F63F|nr:MULTISPECIES: flagellar protein FlaG [Thalassospira]SIT29769.1 FlaG protein [Thalassospira xiamenensis M-5 = DSM 17429]
MEAVKLQSSTQQVGGPVVASSLRNVQNTSSASASITGSAASLNQGNDVSGFTQALSQEIARNVSSELGIDNLDVQLSYSEDTGRVIAVVRDAGGEVLRQIPSESMQTLIARLRDSLGPLIDVEV